MSERAMFDEALALISVVIGTIMEDEVDNAVTALPIEFAERVKLFSAFEQAGGDISVLAAAASVLLRRAAQER